MFSSLFIVVVVVCGVGRGGTEVGRLILRSKGRVRFLFLGVFVRGGGAESVPCPSEPNDGTRWQFRTESWGVLWL